MEQDASKTFSNGGKTLDTNYPYHIHNCVRTECEATYRQLACAISPNPEILKDFKHWFENFYFRNFTEWFSNEYCLDYGTWINRYAGTLS